MTSDQFTPRSMAEAMRIGAKRYFTGLPCKFGHIAERQTVNGTCFECMKAKKRQKSAERGPSQKQQAEARRRQAIAAGETTYYGQPCHRGHDGFRWASSYGCVMCGRAAEAKALKRQYDITYRAALPVGLISERAKAWAKANPEKRKAIVFGYDSRRRTQKAGGATTDEVLAWEKAAKKVCHWCDSKCPKKYHIDHYEPLSKGGKHEVKNLVIACPSCNLRKNAKDPYEFAKERGRLF